MNLHQLIASEHPDGLRAAVEQNPSCLHQPGPHGLPPLYTAALHRNSAVVDLLLNLGAEVDIFACAYLGRSELLRVQLADDPEAAQSATSEGLTALHLAARAGYYEIARLLVAHGADVNAADHRGRKPLDEACHGGPWKPGAAEDIVQLLLTNGAIVDLPTAAAMGRTDLISSLLSDSTVGVNDVSAAGETPLFVAARNDRLEAAQLLIDFGADVDLSGAVNTAALHRMSGQCRDELSRLLIRHSSSAHLCCYVACGDETGVRSVLKNDPASIEEPLYGFRPVEYAIHCWHPAVLRILVQHGAGLSDEDDAHVLRISGDEEFLEELRNCERTDD